MSAPIAPYVVACSRRTDVAACYTGWLVQVLRVGEALVPAPFGGPTRRISLLPEVVHTFVVMSKDCGPLLANQDGVRALLDRYEQLYFQLTITGLGSTPLEPGVPPWRVVAAQLAPLVSWAGDARRVSLRYDPVVHWWEQGSVRSNLPYAPAILDAAASAGVRAVRVSIAALYPKMRRRGWEWYDPPLSERTEIAAYLQELAAARGLTLYACADPSLVQAGLQPSACIDGVLLSALHPRQLALPVHKDPGQRPACGCTPSVDIGSYQMVCRHGCGYCYARPGTSGVKLKRQASNVRREP